MSEILIAIGFFIMGALVSHIMWERSIRKHIKDVDKQKQIVIRLNHED